VTCTTGVSISKKCLDDRATSCDNLLASDNSAVKRIQTNARSGLQPTRSWDRDFGFRRQGSIFHHRRPDWARTEQSRTTERKAKFDTTVDILAPLLRTCWVLIKSADRSGRTVGGPRVRIPLEASTCRLYCVALNLCYVLILHPRIPTKCS
jgi:hypothetical protein